MALPRTTSGAGQLRQLEGHIAGMIAGRVIRLLVSPLVLLINNNQAQVRLGGKKGAARADDDIKLSVLYPPPLVKLLAQRELAVQDGDPVRENGRQTALWSAG